MHEKVHYIKRPSYLGLREEDAAIWERFMGMFPVEYDAVIYNLHIGAGAEIPENTEGVVASDFKLLTQYKIDVVAFKGDRTDIIELKPNAGTSAIGQVQNYAILYQRDIDDRGVPQAVIITDRERPDMKFLTKNAGVKLIIV